MRALLLAALALVPAAQGSHLGQYASNPVEHDDLGRSDEPDGHTTSVLGMALRNTVIDADLDGFADVPTPAPHPGRGLALAPGCTDAQGHRALSGQCGLWTIGAGAPGLEPVVPPRTLDLPGVVVREGSCPGRMGTAPVMLLDARADLTALPLGPTTVLGLNAKLRDLDAATGGVLRGLGVGPSLVGPTALWAWFGHWTDHNCNGVIDHLQSADPPSVTPGNEFTWLGSCVTYTGAFAPATIASGHCREAPNANTSPPGSAGGDARTSMVAYVWPGLHAGLALPDLPDVGWNPGAHPDLVGSDRSGEANVSSRQWLLGNGFPVWTYDQSLLLTTHVITGVNCRPAPSAPTAYDLGATGSPGSPCSFLDVDVYRSVSPLTDALLPPIKSSLDDVAPLLRQPVATVLDAVGKAKRLADTMDHSLYDATGGPQVGLLDDVLLDPGWSREPNVGPTRIGGNTWVRDLYPDALHEPCDRDPGLADGEEAHRGWCQRSPRAGEVAHAAHRAEPRGWLDLQARQVAAWVTPLGLEEGSCIQCTTAPLLMPATLSPVVGGDALDPNDHARTLGPGHWAFTGAMGRWVDNPHTVDGSIPLAVNGASGDPEHYPPDGWVGRVTYGVERYRGFEDRTCVTETGPGLYPYGVCNPYKDGNRQDPQHYVEGNGEWVDACALGSTSTMTVVPLDGSWDIPVFVWRDYEGGLSLLDANVPLESPGPEEAIHLRVGCSGSGSVVSRDHLVLPAGLLDESVVTMLTVAVPLPSMGGSKHDAVTDVDVYRGARTP